jgi:hypothetical protein
MRERERPEELRELELWAIRAKRWESICTRAYVGTLRSSNCLWAQQGSNLRPTD